MIEKIDEIEGWFFWKAKLTDYEIKGENQMKSDMKEETIAYTTEISRIIRHYYEQSCLQNWIT